MADTHIDQLTPFKPYLRRLRLLDLVWVLFVAVLILFNETNYNAAILLILIGAFQILEPRLPPFRSLRGQFVSLSLKMLLCYLLIGYTHTIFSPYSTIFLLPVISAALSLSLPWVILTTVVSCLLYFSFLLPIYIDWSSFELPPDHLQLMGLRSAFFAIIAFLVYDQARARREEIERTRASNRSLRKAEVSLRRSERLAALGQLTAGLAHELRNPLGTIRASAEMIGQQQTASNPELLNEISGYIRSEADRMNGLIGHFLDFARPLQIHPALSALGPVLDEVVREQAQLAGERHITVALDVPAGLTFTFDAGLLRLALTNLLQNALQASPPGATVRVEVAADENSVIIAVQDSGQGIAPENLESIFNPFFTTKPQGTGLGLAIVAKIIDEHGGSIRCRSTVGLGTTFELSLPVELPN